ncbi:GNAT family N-acetyltransferase [Methylovulum psychrotolerans]|uniref:N-acetyltransferase n=1 Tax=Methylovulum psychrotolerans TaxID=1704499 RepID=A0A1Z4BWY3_9GAMM|nr:GNAT family N-acetyltransferase [Methylovulum psychrotolerans]ASF45788.1 GNAT family N-acetyltransferase [Methylovulum psychrotolerans]POZ51761.1 N-acetyltransferase [Methylovulum psychrotolerans]
MQAITLRPETAADELLLRQIYAASRNEELASVPWTDAQKSAFLAMQFDLQRSHYRQHYPNADFLIVSQADKPIGRYYLHRGETDLLLIDIALLPPYRRQGIGSLLLYNLLAEAEEFNKPVQLHVEQFNPAQHLYLKLGFSVIEDKGVHRLMQWRPQASNP